MPPLYSIRCVPHCQTKNLCSLVETAFKYISARKIWKEGKFSFFNKVFAGKCNHSDESLIHAQRCKSQNYFNKEVSTVALSLLVCNLFHPHNSKLVTLETNTPAKAT